MATISRIVPKKKTIPKETSEHINFVKWFWRNYTPEIWHYPSGARLGGKTDTEKFKQIRQLKQMGWINGVPDLFIPEWRLFIEMKRQKGGVVSEDQKERIAYLRSIGYTVFIANGDLLARQFIIDFVKKNYPKIKPKKNNL